MRVHAAHEARRPLITTTGDERAFYLGTAPDLTFAVAHRPAADVDRQLGVVICPLFGWEDVCTHRARRRWAEALVAAGITVIRCDLPGTGDSAGTSQGADQLDSWVNAVSAAAGWLVDAGATQRVTAIGIGFGGMLGWLAAAEGAPIDDFIFWGTPTRGRRIVREIRAGAMLSIDRRVTAPEGLTVEDLPTEGDHLLDESGQLSTPETIRALSALNLSSITPDQADRRRALVLERPGGVDDELLAYLRASGLEVSTADGSSYGNLMHYVQQSSLAPAVTTASEEWLGRGQSHAAPPVRLTRRPALDQDTAVIRHDGHFIRETPTTLQLPSGPVRAIITEPMEARRLGLSVLFFSGGSDRRIGPNRLWVELARRAATRGLTALRADPAGLGDSPGDERQWDHVSQHYRPSHLDHTLELLDAVETQGLPNRFILVGFCSGAYRSVHAARLDPRVAGAFAIGLPFFHRTWWASNIRLSWIPYWEAKPHDSRAKVWVLEGTKRVIRALNRLQHVLLERLQRVPNAGERLLRELDARGIELLFLLKPGSYAWEQASLPQRNERLQRLRRATIIRLPGDDERFRPVVAQRLVSAEIDAALRRVVERETAPVEATVPAPAMRSRVVADSSTLA